MGVPFSSVFGQSITFEGVLREHASRKLLVSVQRMKRLSQSLVVFNDKPPSNLLFSCASIAMRGYEVSESFRLLKRSFITKQDSSERERSPPISGSSSSSRNDGGGKIPSRSTSSRDNVKEIFKETAGTRKDKIGNVLQSGDGPLNGVDGRRYTALYVSKRIFALDGEMDEIVGHAYLFLKEQLEFSGMPPTSSILHGTIIDQFIACGKSRDIANELASQIWLAVLDNLEDNEHAFLILKRLALEGDVSSSSEHYVFLPYPYTKSIKVQWKVFEKLFTDFRDCFSHVDYYDVLGCAKNKFQPIPSAWLGY
ncbi:hypothetical protein SADUNF_Sadunf08G0002100 [Salix dunnii]|uniref:Uncharacterized protein n=1 Tax=Salix dunnii TaxID=1413687 RepID=A0A835JTX9_9ROSI|nr:hypothetical protein SADUNF_Sadunf08G0002100 [Salix dunnii]